MNGFDCLLCRAVLSVVSTGIAQAAMIRLASLYKYVQVFV